MGGQSERESRAPALEFTRCGGGDKLGVHSHAQRADKPMHLRSTVRISVCGHGVERRRRPHRLQPRVKKSIEQTTPYRERSCCPSAPLRLMRWMTPRAVLPVDYGDSLRCS